jgi:hypothetical protein
VTTPPTPVIDLRGYPGDVRYSCPVCGWSVTLKPEGEALWTKDGTITPKCKRDRVDLVRTVITEPPPPIWPS